MTRIVIDPGAGFCPGVNKTIDYAENKLKEGRELYALGELLHNEGEMDRLKTLGLKNTDHSQFNELEGKKILLRTHGEPPETYQAAASSHIELIDGTCAKVKRLQTLIREASREALEKNGQILIYGKKLHPEVIGLKGNSEIPVLVIEDEHELDSVDFNRPAWLFSQTTQDHDGLMLIHQALLKGFNESGKASEYRFYDSVCTYVLRRVEQLKLFSSNHDVIIFAGGKMSSNSKYLWKISTSINPNSYLVSENSEINITWFRDAKSIGITGATSTPKSALKKIAEYIESVLYVS